MLTMLSFKTGILSLISITVTETLVELLLGGEPPSVATTTSSMISDGINRDSLSILPVVMISPVELFMVKLPDLQ